MNEGIYVLNQGFKLIKDYFEPIVFVLACLGIAIDVTPWIKINPVRAILRKVADIYSNYMTKVINNSTADIREKLDEQEKKFDKVCSELAEFKEQSIQDKIEIVRWEILDFGNAIEKHDYDKEMYDHIIERHDWYEKTINERGIPNGRMDITYANIVKKYNDNFCS